MVFSICVGGLKYNIDCLTNQFYERNGKLFECPYSSNAHNLSVSESQLSEFQYFDSKASVYKNETAFLLDCVIKHCLDFNRMIIHGAAISYRNNGYLFIAPSGTGKTTHIGLWKKYLSGVEIISGDKPMLDFDNEITVCGTPWNGKENLGSNISAPLKAIVVLKQGKVNFFKRLDVKDSVIGLLTQSFYSTDKFYGPKIVGYIEEIANNIPIFSLECDISKDAFDVCYTGLQSYVTSHEEL